jgi:hypothetical protein
MKSRKSWASYRRTLHRLALKRYSAHLWREARRPSCWEALKRAGLIVEVPA